MQNDAGGSRVVFMPVKSGTQFRTKRGEWFFGCREELTFVLSKKEKQNKVLKCRIVYIFPWSLFVTERT